MRDHVTQFIIALAFDLGVSEALQILVHAYWTNALWFEVRQNSRIIYILSTKHLGDQTKEDDVARTWEIIQNFSPKNWQET